MKLHMPIIRRTASARAVVAAMLCLAPTIAAAQTYSFASFTWEQSYTPDSGFSLNAGTYSGAIVTAFPSTTANGTGFPTVSAGFDETLSIGELVGLTGSGPRALNLPNGNIGTTDRSGVLLSWSGGRKLQNLTGDDIVVYEAGSDSTSPEGFMIQAFDVSTSSWTSWHYEPAETFELYVGSGAAGAFATAIDLTDLGIASGVGIDRLRLVNLTDEDRTQDSSGVGVVLPEDNGATSTFTPDPGPLAGYTMYSSTTSDPDPLYVAILHEPTAAACGNGAVEIGEQCDPGPDAPGDCCDASCQFSPDATVCDDGNSCTGGTTCTAGACGGGTPTPTCGDTLICGIEQCDDGNVDDGDGCSATCETENAQTRPQKNCIKALNSAGMSVARSQGKLAGACLTDAQRGNMPDAQLCITADVLGRVTKARTKTVSARGRACKELPDFSELDTDVINDAAIDESIALVGDIFGSNLGTAAILSATNSAGASCQKSVLNGYEKVAAAKRRAFALCKAAGLKIDLIRSSAGLRNCLDDVLSDPRGSIGAAKNRLAATILGKCAGVISPFPGACASAPVLADCIDERVNCRVCRTFNRMDAFSRDCDAFDDGVANSSCAN